MLLMIVVLNHTEKLDRLMESLSKSGVRGGTVLDSTGMAKSLSQSPDAQVMGLIRAILGGASPAASKTVMVVLPEVMLETAKTAVRAVLGDMSKPNSGVMFCVPVVYAAGIAEVADEENALKC
ncbi:MAG: hypothetical protein QM689_05480 [Oscillospiraceae bacterium]